MKKNKRIPALLLCLVMCVSLLPVSAVADEEGVDFAQAEASEEAAAEDSAAQEEAPAEDPAAAEETPAEETPAEESAPAEPSGQEDTDIHVSDTGEEDNDTLFAEYVDHVFGTGITLMSSSYAGDRLNGKEKLIYDRLKGWITEVANGERTSTVFYIPLDEVIDKRTFTAEELGVEEITEANVRDLAYQALGVTQRNITNALLADCAYELYWYDKLEGYWYGGFDYPYTPEALTITGDNFRFRFTVSVDYAPEPYDVMGLQPTRPKPLQHSMPRRTPGKSSTRLPVFPTSESWSITAPGSVKM